MKPAWYYERQAAEAERRATYYRTRVPAADTTVNPRGSTSTVYYRSLTKKVGSDHIKFNLNVLDSTLLLVKPDDAGLLTAEEYNALTGAAKLSFGLRGSGVKPSRANWYRGAGTPVAKVTAWNTRYIQYSEADSDTRITHRSIPLSVKTGEFDAGDIAGVFQGIFSGTAKTTLLGAQNGRAQFTLERSPSSVQS